MTPTANTPVDYTYREAAEEAVNQRQSGRIFYFDNNGKLESADGSVVKLEQNAEGWYLELNNGLQLKLHRIITLFGKPGPAYDEYDAFSIQCGECRE
jgi:hypothetical protein